MPKLTPQQLEVLRETDIQAYVNAMKQAGHGDQIDVMDSAENAIMHPLDTFFPSTPAPIAPTAQQPFNQLRQVINNPDSTAADDFVRGFKKATNTPDDDDKKNE